MLWPLSYGSLALAERLSQLIRQLAEPMVGERGFEPPRVLPHNDLNVARLPDFATRPQYPKNIPFHIFLVNYEAIGNDVVRKH